MANVTPPVAPPEGPAKGSARGALGAVPLSAAPKAGAVSWRKRAFAWGLALVALAFVVSSVPVRDRCEDPAAPSATAGTKAARVPVSRESGACVLHRPPAAEGSAGTDERLSAADCARLTCEPGLVSTFQEARVGLLLALCALYFFATFAWAARWRALLRLARVPITLLEAWRITLESQAGGIVLPGGIGGDALRVAFVAQKGANLPTVIAAVLLDRMIGLSTLAGLAAAFSATTTESGHVPFLVVVLAAIPAGLVAGLLLLRWGPVASAPFLVRGPLARVARPVLAYVGEPGAPRAIVTGVAISLVVSGLQLATIRGFVYALGRTPTLDLWVYVGATMSFIVAAVPALPGGWGTGDAAFVYFLGKAGLAPSTALAVSLLYRLFWYSSGAVGAVLYLRRQHGSAIRPLTEAEGASLPGDTRQEPP